MAEPIRRGMELKICAEGDAMRDSVMLAVGGRGGGGMGGGGNSVGSEILEGRDTEVGWGDVFRTGEELREGVSEA